VLVPLAVVVGVRDRWDAYLVLRGVIVVAVLEGAIGWFQFLTRTGAEYDGQPIRATGTFGASDIMGMATVVSFGVIAAAAMALGLRSRQRWVYAAIAVLLIVPLAVSFSRGAWIATCLALGVMLLLSARRLLVGILVALVVFSAVSGTGSSTSSSSGGALVARLTSIVTATGEDPDQSVVDRYSLWDASLTMWAEHPVTGVGLKNFAEHRDSSAPLSLSGSSDIDQGVNGFQKQELLSPHNMYLFVLSELGTVGGLAFFTLFGALLLNALRRTGRAVGGPWAWAGLAATGAAVRQLVDFFYGDIGGPSSIFVSITLGVVAWWAFRQPEGGAELAPAASGPRPAPGGDCA
jgi:O-antigen ligase